MDELMKWTKGNVDLTYESVREFLQPIYHVDINVLDVFTIVFKSWFEALQDSRYEMGDVDTRLLSLLKEPVSGFNAMGGILGIGMKSTDAFEVQEFYKPMITNMLVGLRLSRVDWLKKEING